MDWEKIADEILKDAHQRWRQRGGDDKNVLGLGRKVQKIKT